MEPFTLLVTLRNTPTSRTVCGVWEFLLDMGFTSTLLYWALSPYMTTLLSGRCYLFIYFTLFSHYVLTDTIHPHYLPLLTSPFHLLLLHQGLFHNFFSSFIWLKCHLICPTYSGSICYTDTHTYAFLSLTGCQLFNIFSELATNWPNSCKGYYDYRHLSLNIKLVWHNFLLVMFFLSVSHDLQVWVSLIWYIQYIFLHLPAQAWLLSSLFFFRRKAIGNSRRFVNTGV